MTDPNYTHLELLIDCSGSMNNIASEMAMGINKLISDQTKEPGKLTIGLTEFDSYGNDRVINTLNPARNWTPYELTPRGSTALWAALCASIDRLGRNLESMSDGDRPGAVIYVIVTDGLNNDSREVRASDVSDRITRQENQYGWQFIYMGANQDAIATGEQMGINANRSLTYTPGAATMDSAYTSTSANISAMRSAGGGFAMASVGTFDSHQRASAVQEDEKEHIHITNKRGKCTICGETASS